ncbi:MAG: choice-of-anchor Q domain-containing protein [Planctomycetota bacterium]|jgi:hypothetical protein
MRWKWAVLSVGAAAFVCASVALAEDRLVPSEYPTIQAAIDAAIPGDKIIVAPGLYFENVEILGKNIILTGTNPTDGAIVASTIIDGNDVNSVVTFSGTESPACILAGFTITNGRAYSGGGIYGNHTKATIAHNLITANVATGGPNWDGKGGGIFACDGIIRNNTITNNRALYSGGGVHAYDGMIESNLIWGNCAEIFGGGGIYCRYNWPDYSSCPTIRNCTIVNNTSGVDCTGQYGIGGGIYFSDGNCHAVSSCIIRGNVADDGPQIGLVDYSLNPAEPVVTVAVAYSNIEDGQGAVYTHGYCDLIWGSGNIDTDPCLVDPCNNDYHLSAGSPCINAADPNYVMGMGETDIDGQPRVMGSRLDMGADEFAEDCAKSPDLAPDGNINNQDLRVLTQAWLTTPGREYWNILSDLNCDGVINIADFAVLAMDWTGGSNDDCLPDTLPEYSLWLALGKPDCWCYPRQCHGDADGIRNGPFWVSIFDLNMFRLYYGRGYEPCIDFDRDGDVDGDDEAIIAEWLDKLNVPADCLDPPEPGISYQIEDCNMETGASSLAEYSESTRFTVTVEGQYIRFEDMMVANCCPDELELEMTVEGNLITIYETEYTIAGGCRCMCDFPVTATLGPFASDTYTLEVYEDYGGFIGSTTVTIGSSP